MNLDRAREILTNEELRQSAPVYATSGSDGTQQKPAGTLAGIWAEPVALYITPDGERVYWPVSLLEVQ